MAADRNVEKSVDPNSRASGTGVTRGTDKRGLIAVGLVKIPNAAVARDPETGRQIALPAEARSGTDKRGPIAIGIVKIPNAAVARDPETGRQIAIPAEARSTNDPRTRGDYVDKHVRAVVYGPLDSFYLLRCGETSIGIHVRLVDFRKGHWGPASLEIHSSPQGAFDADQSAEFRSVLTSNPAQSRGTAPELFARLNDPHAFYSFYQARSGTNSYILPTRFNPDSAPQVLELLSGAIEKKIAQVETDLAALKTAIVWQGAAGLVFTVATAALQRFSVPPKVRTLRETVGPQVKAPTPPLKTQRPFLTAEMIRDMRARGVQVMTFRSDDLDVVQNKELTPQGKTNVNFKEKVAFVDGFRGVNYGQYQVTIEVDKAPPRYPHGASGGEFFTLESIPANAGYWTTVKEVDKAFAKP